MICRHSDRQVQHWRQVMGRRRWWHLRRRTRLVCSDCERGLP